MTNILIKLVESQARMSAVSIEIERQCGQNRSIHMSKITHERQKPLGKRKKYLIWKLSVVMLEFIILEDE